MSDEHGLRVRLFDTRDGDFVETECPRCGEIVAVDGTHDCDGDLEFDGSCPMCGERYDTYLEHLKDCDGGR